MRRRTASIAVGGSAVLSGVSYLYSGWLNGVSQFFALCGIAAAGTVVIWDVRTRAGAWPRRKRDLLIAAAVAAAGSVSPYAVRWCWLRSEASRVPRPEGRYVERVRIDPVLFNDRPDDTVSFLVGQPSAAVTDHYVKTLRSAGWSMTVPEREPSPFAIPDAFRKTAGRALQLHEPDGPMAEGVSEGLMIFRRGGRSIGVQVYGPAEDLGDREAFVRIYPFERKPPFTR